MTKGDTMLFKPEHAKIIVFILAHYDNILCEGEHGIDWSVPQLEAWEALQAYSKLDDGEG